MKNKWIKKGDKVVVIAGNDRGTVGEVLVRMKDRILVQGVNIRKKHLKSRDQNRKSEIIEIERSIHISNVALCDGNGKKLKLNVKQGLGKQRELIYLKEGQEKSYRTLRKEK